MLIGQEICDNGIDDDNDGLIDINDDDCECAALINSSLIPNPSFEEMTCCPMENAKLECATDWIQASPATTDYVHTCGNYLGNTSVGAVPPLPFPDGNGAVGFRNGQANAGANYKEYVGACLTERMEIGVEYRIDFFIGFRDNVVGNGEIDIAIFGSTSCNNLPFGNNTNIGCPSNTGLYTQLDQINVRGNNEWVKVTFEFTATQAYEVIVLGPTCPGSANFLNNPYFYIDGLNLAEANEFGVPFSSVSGNICSDDLVLSFENNPESSYQWYKDGVALIGETDPDILLEASNDDPGNYVLLITNPELCFLSEEYFLRIPPYYERDTVSICENSSYMVGTEEMDATGDYEILINAVDGCDSIVLLNLNVIADSESLLERIFCENETFVFNDISTTEAGFYETTIPNVGGCDSIISINLSMIETNAFLELIDTISIDLGQSVDLIPENIDPSVVSFIWTNEEQEVIGNQAELLDLLIFNTTVITLDAFDEEGCRINQEVRIRVDRSNLTLFVPNVFSPNDDGINDYFRFFSTTIVERVENLRIFDRWGNMVFQDLNVLETSNYLGWDGTFNGQKAEVGVYAYTFEASFIDGTKELITGDLTLLR